MNIKSELESTLRGAFAPKQLNITNESAQHAGHAGDDGSGESHFHVFMRAASFEGMSRLERHRAVHAALGDLNQRIHALALDIG